MCSLAPHGRITLVDMRLGFDSLAQIARERVGRDPVDGGAPVNWRQTLEKRDAQQVLDANVFRRAVLGMLDAVQRPQELQEPAAAVSDG